MKKYYGKYQGTVLNNLDPLNKGRINVQVPDVTGLLPSTWALPCVPIAGKQMGTFVVPQKGAGVWVEFEHGDLNRPIWVGGFWGSAAEVPALALAGLPASPSLVFQSSGQNCLVISDLPGPAGGLILKHRSGAFISVSDVGIVLSSGQGATITLIKTAVSVNMTALVVT
jgi:Type VI secretion system/phage-baseplate injector OB domain